MDKQAVDIMFCLMRYDISSDEGLIKYDLSAISKNLETLYKLSKAHDMAHIVSDALFKLGGLSDDEFSQKFTKQNMIAVYRCEQITYEFENVKDALEAEKIPFMPLKGAVIREYYPEPWMRTSCDIDILVHKEDLDKATDLLVEKLGFRNEGKSSHDVQLFSPSGVHLELHYDLVEENLNESAIQLLSKVWEHTTLKDGFKYYHVMDNDIFFFYHVAHMVKHFQDGGCGVKPFLDMYFMDANMNCNIDAAKDLLLKGELLTFAECAKMLSDLWFKDIQSTELILEMEEYVLSGGVYGTMENRVAVQSEKKGGRIRYTFSRIFLKYDKLKYMYPVLQKHRCLMPVCQFRRWCDILFKGRFGRSVKELRVNSTISKDKAKNTKEFLSRVGL